MAFKPFNLAGSGGSTPLRITVKGDPETYLFAKLYSATHLRSDRWYKLGRTLLFGQLEDEKAFNRVRRLVQYEDYLLRLMRDAGLPVPPPYGVVEITPEREYLLVTAFLFSRLIDEFALTIELTRTCDRGAASETATDQPGTRRFDERIRTGSSYRDRRFYLLPGACVAFEFRLTGVGAEEAAEQISHAIGFVPRDQLADQVRSYSDGLLQLDPERSR